MIRVDVGDGFGVEYMPFLICHTHDLTKGILGSLGLVIEKSVPTIGSQRVFQQEMSEGQLLVLTEYRVQPDVPGIGVVVWFQQVALPQAMGSWANSCLYSRIKLKLNKAVVYMKAILE